MMTYLILVLELLVAALLLAIAAGSVLRRPAPVLLLTPPPSTRWARIVVAILATLPGIGMIIATVVPFLAFFAALLSVTATGVIAAVARLTGSRMSVAAATAVTIASVGVAALQPLGLKVLSLPRADPLPYRPVEARVIKTYDAGIGFEGIAAGPDGMLYLAANSGLDLTASPYYRRAKGQIIARAPDGSERVLFTTPLGSTGGVIKVARDGTLYMTSNGDAPGIWRVTRAGAAVKIGTLPKGAWPNGLDFGPDGMLYIPDSNLAQVWRVDPVSGRADAVLKDRRLAARPFIALAPGANGLHFAGRDMIVTVSDQTEVLKYRLGADGSFSAPKLIARGIPGDDFAIGADGALFVTTHPYNTLVRVSPDGRRTIIADASQGIVGPTDAAFGRGTDDRDTLYVVTDGGAFTAGTGARGQLIALRPYR